MTIKIFTPSNILKTWDVKRGLLVFFMLLFDSGISLAADTFKGGELYAVHCASCHGAAGISIMPNAPNFSRNEGLLQPDKSLLISIRNGKSTMPSYQGILTDHDIMDVIVYLRTLN